MATDQQGAENETASGPSRLHVEHMINIYNEINSNIRATDEISFKLLGIVPLASGVGAGALTLLEKSGLLNSSYSGRVIVALSALGAMITLGLYWWELRNVQRCNWYISRAARLEQEFGCGKLQFDGMAPEGHRCPDKLDDVALLDFRRFPQGKAWAETLVYLAAFVTWGVPFVVGLSKL